MSWESAEMVKHALNAYLATCVSYSSEISDLCELLGANMMDVVSALKSDRRVSPFAPINPGMGFAGATLGRDIKNLKYLGLEKNYKTKLFNIVYKVNQERLDWLIKKIVKNAGKLKGLNIGILGLTYKPGTNTLRRSMSLELADKLHRAGAIVRAFDPVIKENIETHKFINIVSNETDFFKDLEAAVLMTEWPEFKEVKVERAGKMMKKKIIFDTKNFLDKNDYLENMFLYIGTGI
jgi:UDPglucose 6-dehydrogenase